MIIVFCLHVFNPQYMIDFKSLESCEAVAL